MANQPIRNEMLINGTWTNVTTYTRGRDTANMSITRGSSAEQGFLSNGTLDFTLNNRDGRFSNRNPNSPYFGLIGRNVQFRSGMSGMDKHVRLIDASTSTGAYDGAEISTADKAALDITGDIDIRIDIEPDDWNGGYVQLLAGKYVNSGGSNQRSWYLYLNERGMPGMVWSTDGTLAGRITTEPSTNPQLSGRMALRVTLDVNNGSGGYTATWYTSTSIAGSWTQIGQTVTTSGTTSIFSSTANLEIGDINGASDRQDAVTGAVPLIGRVYGFELRNGIGGSKVAEIELSGRTRGDTSWSDGLGNTWTCAASASVDDEDYRFWGQTTRLPQKWDGTGTDIYVPASCGDRLQLVQNVKKPLRSPIYRNLSRYTLDSWHTCEDGSTASSLGAAAGNAGIISEASFVSDADLVGSDGVLSYDADTGYATATAPTGSNTGTAFWLWYFKLTAIPAGTIEPLYVYYSGGTLARVALSVGVANWTITAYKTDGTTLGTSSTAHSTAPPNNWVAMRLKLTQNGSNIDYEWAWYPIGYVTTFGTSGTWNSATCGRPSSWLTPSFTGKSGMRHAHIVLNRADVAFSDYTFTSSTNAYVGEDPTDRFARLAIEEGIPWFVRGKRDQGPGMGPQGTKTLVDLWQECAAVCEGMLYSPRDKYGVTLRTFGNIANRFPLPEISYTSNHLVGSLDPDEVTSGVTNDVTANKENGSFRRYVKTSGSLNVNDPTTDPNGAGLLDSTITRNVNDESELLTQAQWEVFRSTWDELRYPTVQLELARDQFTANASLTTSVRRFDLGDAFALTDLNTGWLPPEDVKLLIRGYTETYDNKLRGFSLNCTPYGPYDFGLLADSMSSPQVKRRDSSDTTLASTVTSTASPLTFSTVTAQNRWTLDYANYDAVLWENGQPSERFTILWTSNVGSLAPLEGGFETGITGWTSSGTMTLTQSTDFAHVGTYSCKAVVTGTPSTASVLNNTQVAVSPSVSYTATIWVYSTSSVNNVTARIAWYTGAGVFLSNSGTAITLSANTWTKVTITATSPGTAGLARYGMIISGSPATGTTVYLDDVDLVLDSNGLTSAGPYQQIVHVTRSVNGIVKAGTAGSEIHVFQRGYRGRK